MSDEIRDKLLEMRTNVEVMRMCGEQMIEAQRLQAKFIRAKYLGLMEEGFSAAEALDIIKARGVE